jgi:arsenite/tail-anchored protein-transporting ATPase
VLLISTDPAHNLGHLFERAIGPEVVVIAPGLSAMELDPERTVDAHLTEVGWALRRLMPVHLAGEVDKHLELARHAPGMTEAAMLERIAESVESASDYDHVIFDTAPSGHTARLMALPELMSAWTDGLLRRRDRSDRLQGMLQGLGRDHSRADVVLGDDDAGNQRDARIRQLLNRRRRRFAELRDALSDPARTSFVIVLTAERLPVLETIELAQSLRDTGMTVGGLVVNKRVPVLDEGFMAERRGQEARHLNELLHALPELAVQELVLQRADILGFEGLEEFGRQLV